jgi:hypothetical protein
MTTSSHSCHHTPLLLLLQHCCQHLLLLQTRGQHMARLRGHYTCGC